MKLIDAIIKILEEAHAPLHLREITERLINDGLWQTSGKTPADTVGAKIYTHIKKNGENSLFIKVAPQTFKLGDKNKNNSNTKINSVCAEKTYERPITGSLRLSFTDCAQKVLEDFGDKKPMHYREITQKALENGWLTTNGKNTRSHHVCPDYYRNQTATGQRRTAALYPAWAWGGSSESMARA